MKVENTSTVSLTTKDLETIVIEHLKNKNIIKEDEKFNIGFDTRIKTEGEDLFSPGYKTAVFEGCTVTIHRK